MKDVAVPNVLRVEGLTKSFGSVTALADVSFTLAAGEVLGVIGPSGGGKSTLLRCLDVLTPLDSGSLHFALDDNSIDVTSEGVFAAEHSIDPSTIRRRLGLVFQHLHLWPERRVIDNLTLAPTIISGKADAEIRHRAETLAERFGIGGKLDAHVWELSGGQRQRVAIARALMLDPRLLLLDEITSALDPILTADVMATIRDLREHGMTMVLVTHHIEFAVQVCDRILFLDAGRIAAVGSSASVLESADQAVRRFVTVLRSTR